MKHLFSNCRIQLIVAVSLANLSLPVLQAKSRCPGGAASVTPRFVQRALNGFLNERLIAESLSERSTRI